MCCPAARSPRSRSLTPACASSRRDRQRGLGREGKLRIWPARISALYPPARMGGPRHSRCVAVGRPCEDRGLAEAERITRERQPDLARTAGHLRMKHRWSKAVWFGSQVDARRQSVEKVEIYLTLVTIGQ